MQNPFKHEGDEALNTQIAAVFVEMSNLTPGTKEYQTLVDQLDKLYKMKHDSTPKLVSRDTLVMAAVTLLVPAMVMIYENKHVMGQRTASMLPKPKW